MVKEIRNALDTSPIETGKYKLDLLASLFFNESDKDLDRSRASEQSILRSEDSFNKIESGG